MTRSLLSRLRLVRRHVLLHRRGLAALCAGGAVLLGLHATAPPSTPTTPVWTAARSLPSGHVLQRSDVRRTGFAPGTAPAAPARLDQLVGRTVAAPLSQGEPLTDAAVLGPGLLARADGRAVVPVRVTDPEVAGLLRVGDSVDLVGTDPDHPGEPRLLARQAVVLALPSQPDSSASSALPGRLVVFGVPAGTEDTVVTDGSNEFVTAVWTG